MEDMNKFFAIVIGILFILMLFSIYQILFEHFEITLKNGTVLNCPMYSFNMNDGIAYCNGVSYSPNEYVSFRKVNNQ